jgi:beta-glucosidase
MNQLPPSKGMTEVEIAAAVEAILAEATLEEKVGMMSGHGFFEQYKASQGTWGAHAYRAGGGIERLGVPALYFTDGPRGVARGNSTCFPCSMARGASFDADLEHRIGQDMGIEARAQGATLSGAVCINLLRHPAWGRAQETYGEDPHLLGEMAVALGTGIQTHNVVATVKHFALNSMENARFKVDVRIDERTLHEIYLPHFKRALDAGLATVMSAYNKMNGEYCGQNRHLLTAILRGEWGFDGFVHSDWVFGVYKPYGAAAGLDVENPEPVVFGAKLVAAVEQGHVEPQVIDDACRRILRVIYRFAAAEDPLETYDSGLVASPGHRQLALEAARKSAVLLENRGVLPLKRGSVNKLAVLGRLAAIENTGDFGSSRVRPPYVVTALAGLQHYLGADNILTGDEGDLDLAARAVSEADASIVVVGYTADDEGEYIPGDISLGQDGSDASEQALAAQNEIGGGRPSRGGDRLDLGLKAEQIALIEAAAASGKPVIVVVVAGSAVLVEPWRERAGAILQTFYSGMEGGTALAELLFGDISPSGKLPFTVARDPQHYPFFDREAESIEYEYWHGYAKFEYEAVEPRYAFGYGLSYTRFAYRALQARATEAAVEVSVAVRNAGDCAGDEVVQVYVGFPGTVQPRAKASLKAFARVSLEPGETRVVRLRIPLVDLRYRDPVTHSWRLEHGPHEIVVGRSAHEPELTTRVSL